MRKPADHVQDATVFLIRVLVASSIAGFGERVAGVTFGVNYGKIADNLPAPAEVVRILQSISITKSKLYDPDPLVLRTFSNTGISFIVGTYNEDLPSLTNPLFATSWVKTNVAAYMPSTAITGIVVGNEIYGSSDTNLIAQVLPAMKNIYSALKSFNLHRQIFVSTAHSFSILSSSFPPSAGAMNPAIANLYMKPILEFLDETRSPFLINVYPFFAYKDNPTEVSLEYVLFQASTGVVDEKTGLQYYNMFDAQMDAVYSAISALGYNNITLLVSETGWPSLGDANEPGASITNAQIYHANLVRHITSNKGTPLKPNVTLEVYLFALFNEDKKPGPTSERNYGLFRPDGSKVYEFSFSQSSSAHSILPCHIHTIVLITISCVTSLLLSICTNSNSIS